MSSSQRLDQNQKAKKEFEQLDTDKHGLIDKNELMTSLKKLNFYSDEEAKRHTDEFFEKYDKNKDGKISYEEFLERHG